jgi:hypothetical protein
MAANVALPCREASFRLNNYRLFLCMSKSFAKIVSMDVCRLLMLGYEHSGT